MAAARGKLNISFVVRLFTSRRHNKNPDRFSDRGFSLLRFSPNPIRNSPYQSLRFAAAMMMITTKPALRQKTALSGAH
jgi:hypothetical protein